MSISTILAATGGPYQLTISAAPQRPTGLSYFDVNEGGFTVSWTSTPGAFSYQAVATALSDGQETNGVVTGTQAVWTGLDAGETYNVVVVAINPAGETPSITLTITTTPPLFAPNIPVLGTGINTTGTTFDFTFTASVVDDTHGFASSYEGIADDGAGGVHPATGVASPLSFVGLLPSTTYTVTMRALNAAGASAFSAPSAPVTTSAALAPVAPSIIGFRQVTTSGFQCDFNVGARTDTVSSLATEGGNNYPATSTGINPTDPTKGVAVFQGLPPAKTYTVTVTASNTIGSTVSGPATQSTDILPPDAPVITDVQPLTSAGTEAIILFNGVPNFQTVGPPPAAYGARLYFNNDTQYLQLLVGGNPVEAQEIPPGAATYRIQCGSASNALEPSNPIKGQAYNVYVYGSNAGGLTNSQPFPFTYPL